MLGLGPKSPIVMCPGCDQPMEAVEQKYILFTNGLVDITYVCETCHTNTIRTINPDNRTEPG